VDDSLQPGDLALERRLVKKQQRGECLVLVEALTCRSVASALKKPVISGSPSSPGWRRPWKWIYRRIQPT
jgi:hypothetical protein